MKKYTILFIVISCIITFLNCSCNNRQDQKEKNATNLLRENWYSTINAEDLVDTLSYKVIRLESSEQCLFGNIDKLLIDDDNLVVFDRDYSKSVLVFDSNGKFLTKIGKQGRGPGEYARLSDVEIIKEKKQIVLYDLNSRKLLFYTYHGDFVREIKLKIYSGMFFSAINDSLFAFYLHYSPQQEEELLFLNGKGELVKSLFKRKGNNLATTILNMNYFAKSDSDLYIMPCYSDKIYQVTDPNNIAEKICFNLGNEMVDGKDLKKVKKPDQLFELKKFISFQNIYINNNGYFLCNSIYENQPIQVFGDLNSGKMLTFHNASGKYSFDGIFATYKDYFVIARHPILFKKLYPDAQVNDNKCIVFFKFKNIENIKLISKQ